MIVPVAAAPSILQPIDRCLFNEQPKEQYSDGTAVLSNLVLVITSEDTTNVKPILHRVKHFDFIIVVDFWISILFTNQLISISYHEVGWCAYDGHKHKQLDLEAPNLGSDAMEFESTSFVVPLTDSIGAFQIYLRLLTINLHEMFGVLLNALNYMNVELGNARNVDEHKE